MPTVRFGGTIVLVGLIQNTLTLQSHAAIFKHLNILGSYGGTTTDTASSLDLIAKGFIVPQVEMDSLANLPQVLESLHAGKIRSRMVLVPEGMEEKVGLQK